MFLTCSCCGKELDELWFYPHKESVRGFTDNCKLCLKKTKKRQEAKSRTVSSFPLDRADKGEYIYQDELAKAVGGKREVPTAVGNIDVVTTTTIYEVKKAKDWKHALGQVLAYSKHYQRRKKVIALFEHTEVDHKAVETTCRPYKVEVLWLNPPVCSKGIVL